MAQDETRRLQVDEPGGARLDRYLADNYPELSRSQVQKIISGGHLLVNDRAAKAGLRLRAGDRIIFDVPPPEATTLIPESLPLDIIYEDADVLVLNKPVGLTVHPAPGHRSHTLVNALLAYLPEAPDTGDPARPGIVHRLDKDTSGVMVVALTATAHKFIAEQFREHTVDKTYIVLVKGRLSPEKGVVEAAIGRDRTNRQRMAVSDKGREAVTRYRVREYIGNYTLLEITLETGRTHQIRVHLKAIGFPVVGDATYGVKSKHLSRQFVHAWRLGFRLPAGGEYHEFSAELPADLEQALAAFREKLP
jgi:23S rRNA pseudouridine1911/1915/1917 synthase